MRRTGLIPLLLWTCATMLQAQSKDNAVIKNLRLGVKDNDIIVSYDIEGSSPDTLHSINLSFITSDNDVIVPELVYGDIGEDIPGGSGKTIRWKYSAEYDKLNKGIKPYMIIDGVTSEKIPRGGPEKMFLSMLIPGLGDYFVADTRKMVFKPYIRLASVGTFIALGYNSQRDRWVDYYESTVIRTEYVHGIGWTTREETISLAGDTHYKYFKHDSEIFYTLGAAIWLADVFWVLNKGHNNSLLQKSLKNSTLNFSPSPGGAALTLTF